MKHSFISKTDLAQAYFPYIQERCARKKLMQYINEDPELLTQLLESGYNPMCHQFSPKQVEIIFNVLGNPFA